MPPQGTELPDQDALTAMDLLQPLPIIRLAVASAFICTGNFEQLSKLAQKGTAPGEDAIFS